MLKFQEGSVTIWDTVPNSANFSFFETFPKDLARPSSQSTRPYYLIHRLLYFFPTEKQTNRRTDRLTYRSSRVKLKKQNLVEKSDLKFYMQKWYLKKGFYQRLLCINHLTTARVDPTIKQSDYLTEVLIQQKGQD